MRGSENIAKILKDSYGIDAARFDGIEYKVDRFSEEISRVKITPGTCHCLSAPIYSMFDGYHMYWYGDYGEFTFNCTWKADVTNLAYSSPYYQLEKLRGRPTKEYDSETCKNELLSLIKDAEWYEGLEESEKRDFDAFIEDAYSYIGDYPSLEVYEDTCESLKDLIESTADETDFIYKVRTNDFSESEIYEIFGREKYELYNLGQKEPCNYFIILYLLSIVAKEIGCENENA